MPVEMFDVFRMLGSLVLPPLIRWGAGKIGEMYRSNENYRKAVNAITRAVKNTDEYLREVQSGGERARHRELNLAVDWDIAGISLEEVAETDEEKQLAKKLRRLKKDAWENYDKWSDEDIKKAGIEISTIREELKKFIEISEQESEQKEPE